MYIIRDYDIINLFPLNVSLSCITKTSNDSNEVQQTFVTLEETIGDKY